MHHHEAAVREVERLPWLVAPELSADIACEILRVAIDPKDDAGDVPWCRALGLVQDSHVGLHLARQWFGYHAGARYDEGRVVSTSVEAVSVYAVAAFEWLTGNVYDARLWYAWAGSMTEEGRPGLDLAIYVRAVRLLHPILLRLRTDAL
jgi:hypothetical protein